MTTDLTIEDLLHRVKHRLSVEDAEIVNGNEFSFLLAHSQTNKFEMRVFVRAQKLQIGIIVFTMDCYMVDGRRMTLIADTDVRWMPKIKHDLLPGSLFTTETARRKFYDNSVPALCISTHWSYHGVLAPFLAESEHRLHSAFKLMATARALREQSLLTSSRN